jgi:hypothetical protein
LVTGRFYQKGYDRRASGGYKTRAVSVRGLAAVFVVALAAAAPVGARLTADHASLPDAVGDGDPDITNVTAASNGSGGLTFIVEIANRTDLAEEEFVQIFIDSDHNQATGTQPNGVEYALQMDRQDVVLFRWDSAKFAPVASSSAYGYIFKGFRLGVRLSDLGSPTGSISYWAETVSGQQGDDAPNGQIADLPLSTTPLQLSVTEFAASAKTVKAGKRFGAGMRVQRSDLEEIASAGEVSCSAKVGARSVKAHADFPEDVALCFGTAPKWAKGKTLKITLTFELDGVSVSRAASLKVR